MRLLNAVKSSWDTFHLVRTMVVTTGRVSRRLEGQPVPGGRPPPRVSAWVAQVGNLLGTQDGLQRLEVSGLSIVEAPERRRHRRWRAWTCAAPCRTWSWQRRDDVDLVQARHRTQLIAHPRDQLSADDGVVPVDARLQHGERARHLPFKSSATPITAHSATSG